MLFRLLASLLIAGSAALRAFYLINNCPLDLSPDEAHYWDWSRHPDWSYYSKGPLVAWLIRASCELFGDWSVGWTGTEMAAVRLPAVVCGCFTLLGLYLLTFRVYRSDKMALGVVAIALTLPVFAAGAILMTIDAPFVCCWTWALLLAHAVVFGSRPQASHRADGCLWMLLGFVIGLGILAKYTMILFLPSLALFLFFSGIHRSLRLRHGFWLMSFVAALCCLPILIWNVQHGWITLRHVGRQAGLQNESFINPLGPLEYLGGQFALLLGFWFVAYLLSVVRPSSVAKTRQAGTTDNGQPTTDSGAFLCWMSAPMFLVFLVFSLKTKVQLNWPVTAYLSGLVLAAGWLARQWNCQSMWWRPLARGTIVFASLLGLSISVVMHRTEWLYPLVEPLTAHHPLFAAPRRWDPTCRLRGWWTLATAVDRLRHELRSEGIEPVLAGSSWTLPGELAFYLPDHPPVYSLGLAMGGRHSQYDLWRPNPVWDPERFAGCTVIYVGEIGEPLRQAFERVDPPRLVTHAVHGLPVAAWPVTVCRGFKGFGVVDGPY